MLKALTRTGGIEGVQIPQRTVSRSKREFRTASIARSLGQPSRTRQRRISCREWAGSRHGCRPAAHRCRGIPMAESARTPDTMPDEQSPITIAPSTPPVVGPPGPPRHTERRKRSVGWRSRDILRTAVLVIGLYIVIQLLWFANELFLTAF